MSGNVWEWYFETPIRGGSYQHYSNSSSSELRIGNRDLGFSCTRNTQFNDLGFRIARTGYVSGEVTPPAGYLVTFNAYNGTANSKQTVTNGNTVTKPSNPTNPGYGTFENWYDNEERTGSPFNFTIPITRNITLYAKWTANYELGSTGPGGGKIFYQSEIGFTMTDTNEVCHYLEAAPNNMSTILAWASSGYTYTNISGTGTEIGTGRKNTALILATDANAPAAKACKDYSGGGKTDWFLPSQYELNELYKNRGVVGNMGSSYYWSSSQHYYGSDSAWSQYFANGGQDNGIKGNNLYDVRAIRAF
jgi:uncharacterized repeat protein (TIGR02543 family)